MLNLDKIVEHIKSIIPNLSKHPKSIINEKQRDIKLSIDKFLHNEITRYLKSGSEFPVLSEEDENQVDFLDFDSFFWIVDPLDGSFNFYRSIPVCCISIALWNKIQPIMGVIYDFNRNEIFTGVVKETEVSKEVGSWLNGKPITISDVKEKAKGVICMGFSSWRDFGTEGLSQFIEKVKQWKKVRLVGSAALSLAWLACGRVDAYIEEDISIWDVAAGLAIVEAAGGEIFCKPKGRNNSLTAIATNGNIPVEELKK